MFLPSSYYIYGLEGRDGVRIQGGGNLYRYHTVEGSQVLTTLESTLDTIQKKVPDCHEYLIDD